MSQDAKKPVMNIADAPLNQFGKGEKFSAQIARMGGLIGAQGLGCSYTVVPPGKRAFPMHRHHVIEELFFIVAGEGTYRYGKESYPVKAGDLITAPAGTAPHQLVNNGAQDLRFLAISTKSSADIVDYPESDKIAFVAGAKGGDMGSATIKYMGRRQPADYWDGESS
jgi:uncharacterized cupin superfamily protein